MAVVGHCCIFGASLAWRHSVCQWLGVVGNVDNYVCRFACANLIYDSYNVQYLMMVFHKDFWCTWAPLWLWLLSLKSNRILNPKLLFWVLDSKNSHRMDNVIKIIFAVLFWYTLDRVSCKGACSIYDTYRQHCNQTGTNRTKWLQDTMVLRTRNHAEPTMQMISI